MDEVFIDMRYQNDWIKKYFNADFVSIEQLIGCIEDLDGEIEHLKEEINELRNCDGEDPDAYDRWLEHQLERNE